MSGNDMAPRPTPAVIAGAPGDCPATAQSLDGLGANLLVSAATSGQIDFYAFTLPPGGATVVIEISQANAALELVLCDAQGNVVADGGGRSFGRKAQIARFLAEGRFFIAVGEFFASDEEPCGSDTPVAKETLVGDSYSLSLMLASPGCGGDKPGTGACCHAGHPCELPTDVFLPGAKLSSDRGPLRPTFGVSPRRRPV